MLKAKFVLPQAGYFRDQDVASTFLIEGWTYEVDRVVMSQSHTSIWLKGYPVPFNSVQFEFYKDGEKHDIYNDPEYNPYIGFKVPSARRDNEVSE